MKRYLVVFGSPYSDKEEAEKRAEELEEETNYTFYVEEVEYKEETEE